MELLEILAKNPTVPVVVVGTVIAYLSLRSQQHLARAKHTLDFDKEFKEKHKTKLLRASRVIRSMSWADLAVLGRDGKMIEDETDPFTTIVESLNVWEGVAIGLGNRVYGESQLFDAYGTTVVWLFTNTMPFVKARQAENPRLFSAFSQLGMRWSAKLSLPLHLIREKEQRALVEQERNAEETRVLRESIRLELLAEMAAREHS